MSKLIRIKLAVIIIFVFSIKLIAQDANPKITFAGKTNIVGTDEKKITETSIGKIYLSAGVGVGFPFLLMYSPDVSAYPGANFQLNVAKVLQPEFAIRGDLQISHYRNKFEMPSVEGGNWDNYSLNCDLLFGGFKTSNKVNGYAIAGGGLNILNRTDTKYYYQDVDYSFTIRNRPMGIMGFNLGGGLNYKFSGKTRFFAEAEYSFPVMAYSGSNFGISFAGIIFGTPSLRAGVQLEL